MIIREILGRNLGPEKIFSPLGFTVTPSRETFKNIRNVHQELKCKCTCNRCLISEAWGPPQFQEKRSRSEKAILGALGEFRGIPGAALGIGNSILGIRNSILGMASHDLINTKTTILGATLGAIPGIAANPPERFSFAPAFSELFFQELGWSPRTRLLVPK